MKCCFVTSQVIYPANDGGKKVVLGKVMELVEKGYDLTVLSFNSYGIVDESVSQFFEQHGIKYFEFTPGYAKNKKSFRFFIDYLIKMFSLYPKFCSNFLDKVFIQEIRKTCNDCDTVIFDTLYLLPLSKLSIFKTVDLKIIVHNVESRFLSEISRLSHGILKKIGFKYESVRAKNLERKIPTFANANCYVFLTKEDSEYYTQRISGLEDKTSISLNKLYLNYNVDRTHSQNNGFLFPGSINFPPNFEGMKWFCEGYDKLVPKEQKLPVWVTGNAPQALKDQLQRYDFLVFKGYLDEEELISLYRDCKSVISPILSGSGVKIKCVETVQLDVPLIMTPFSAIGVNFDENNSVYIAEDSTIESFISEVNKLLDS